MRTLKEGISREEMKQIECLVPFSWSDSNQPSDQDIRKIENMGFFVHPDIKEPWSREHLPYSSPDQFIGIMTPEGGFVGYRCIHYVDPKAVIGQGSFVTSYGVGKPTFSAIQKVLFNEYPHLLKKFKCLDIDLDDDQFKGIFKGVPRVYIPSVIQAGACVENANVQGSFIAHKVFLNANAKLSSVGRSSWIRRTCEGLTKCDVGDCVQIKSANCYNSKIGNDSIINALHLEYVNIGEGCRIAVPRINGRNMEVALEVNNKDRIEVPLNFQREKNVFIPDHTTIFVMFFGDNHSWDFAFYSRGQSFVECRGKKYSLEELKNHVIQSKGDYISLGAQEELFGRRLTGEIIEKALQTHRENGFWDEQKLFRAQEADSKSYRALWPLYQKLAENKCEK